VHDLLAILTPKSRSGVTFRACDIAPKISNTRLGYWRLLVLNFTPIGEVPAEKTVTEQKN